MSEISGIGNIINPYARNVARPALYTPATRTIPTPNVEAERVEQSRFGALLSHAVEQSSFQIARARAIRAEIENGTFETAERIKGTVERLLDVIA